jgi:uncharacterized membrane-anchored protein
MAALSLAGTRFPALAATAAPTAPAPETAGGTAKLPCLTPGFWVMKICATTLGETGGDLFSMTLGLGYATSSLALTAILAAVLAVQMFSRRYVPAIYWAVILLTSTAGTTMSDFMDRTLHLGYLRGSAILLTMLALIFVLWRLTGETFSVTRIRSRRAELLYWVAILFSNTLGTALGDFLAHDSQLGFTGGALLIGSVIAIITLAYLLTDISRVMLFWMAFVLTRPFGATMGDVLTKTHAEGGLGFGTVGSSAVLGGILLVMIAGSTWHQRKR